MRGRTEAMYVAASRCGQPSPNHTTHRQMARPNHLVTAVAFEAMDQLKSHFGAYSDLVTIVMQGLREAVFTDVRVLEQDLANGIRGIAAMRACGWQHRRLRMTDNVPLVQTRQSSRCRRTMMRSHTTTSAQNFHSR